MPKSDTQHALDMALHWTHSFAPLGTCSTPLNVVSLHDKTAPLEARQELAKQLGTPEGLESVALHGNGKVPSTIIENEQPIHRIMVHLYMEGKSYDDIAKMTGYSYAGVQNILAQPFARRRMAEIADEDQTKLKSLIAGEAVNSVIILKELRDNVKTPEGVRAKICIDFLDRHLGKAPSTVTIKGKSEPQTIEEIDTEMHALRERQKDLTGRPRVRDVPETVGLMTDGTPLTPA